MYLICKGVFIFCWNFKLKIFCYIDLFFKYDKYIILIFCIRKVKVNKKKKYKKI